MNASEPREDAIARHDDFAEWLARDWPLYHVDGIVAVRMRSAWNAALAQQGASLEGDASLAWQNIETAEVEFLTNLADKGGLDPQVAGMLRHCAKYLAALASKASPDDQRQEGAVLDWTAGGTRFDYARIGTVSGEVARQLIHDAYQSGRAGTGYTAQVDALHDAASPPTEAAAAVGEDRWALHLMGPDDVYAAPSYEAALRVANAVNLHFADHPVKPYAVVVPWLGGAEAHAAGHDDWERNWNDAALSPTASAAREG